MSESQTTTDWKETVRMIYDMMHGRKFGMFCRTISATETTQAVIGLIEERHPDYFVEATEWKK